VTTDRIQPEPPPVRAQRRSQRGPTHRELGHACCTVIVQLLPIGLLAVAQDVPFLKEPVGRGMLWLERKWMLRKQRKHGERNATIEQVQ